MTQHLDDKKAPAAIEVQGTERLHDSDLSLAHFRIFVPTMFQNYE